MVRLIPRLKPYHYTFKTNCPLDSKKRYSYREFYGRDTKVTVQRSVVLKYFRHFVKQGAFSEAGVYVIHVWVKEGRVHSKLYKVDSQVLHGL